MLDVPLAISSTLMATSCSMPMIPMKVYMNPRRIQLSCAGKVNRFKSGILLSSSMNEMQNMMR